MQEWNTALPTFCITTPLYLCRVRYLEGPPPDIRKSRVATKLLSSNRVKVYVREGQCGGGGPDSGFSGLSPDAIESPLLAFLEGAPSQVRPILSSVQSQAEL